MSGNYAFYTSLITLLVFAVFIFTGSIIAFCSKRNLGSFLLIFSSGVGLISMTSISYILVQVNFLFTRASTIDEMTLINSYVKYQEFFSYTALFSYCLFSGSFIVFCSSIANIRKRNEQLEFMVDELTKKIS